MAPKITNRPKRKDPNRLRNAIILIIVIAGLAAAGVYAAKNAGDTGKAKLKPHQETEEVKKGDLTLTVKGSGNLAPWEKIDLRPEASGKVEKLFVEAGDYVTVGQVVALLDQSSQIIALDRAKANVKLFKAQLEETKKGYRDLDKISMEDSIKKAEIRFHDAEREFNRVDELYKKGFASQKEYDQAKTLLDQAERDLIGLKDQLAQLLKGGEDNSVERSQASYTMALAELKEAERLLGDATVVAPMDGVVLQRYVTEGSVILSGLSTFSQGEILMTIGDVKRMKLTAQIDEADISKVTVGQKVLCEVDAFTDDKFEGEVKRISPQGLADASIMTTFGVEIEIDNTDNRLKSGFTSDVEIVVEELKDVVMVPFRSVLEKDGKSYVFVVDSSDMIEEREVKLGKTNYDYYEVTEGLQAGEKVITKGRPNKLKAVKGENGSGGSIQVKIN